MEQEKIDGPVNPPHPTNHIRDSRSIGELLGELTEETRLLLQQEIQLAKAEISEKVAQVERGAVSLSIGGALCYAGFLALLTAAFFGLAMVLDAWLSALIIGVVVFAIGSGFVAKGREDLKTTNLMKLPRTSKTLQEDKQWIKAQMK